MKKAVLLSVFIVLFSTTLLGQCKDISLGKAKIDSALAIHYDSINSDVFLVINYGNSYLKYDGWGLIITFNDGKTKALKFTLEKNDQINQKEIKNRNLLSLMQRFFIDKLWGIPDTIRVNPDIAVFHPDQLKIHYSDQSTNWCLYFKKLDALDERSNKDKRVVWIRSIIKKM